MRRKRKRLFDDRPDWRDPNMPVWTPKGYITPEQMSRGSRYRMSFQTDEEWLREIKKQQERQTMMFALEYLVDDEIFVAHVNPTGRIEIKKSDYTTSDKIWQLDRYTAQISIIKESEVVLGETKTWYQRIGEVKTDVPVSEKIKEVIASSDEDRRGFYGMLKRAHDERPD